MDLCAAGKQMDLMWFSFFVQQFNKYVICFHRCALSYGKESIIIQWKEQVLHSAESQILMHLGESSQLV